MGIAAEIADIYRASKKKRDINKFTQYVMRPPASIVVYFLAKTRVTPNQVTFLSAIIAAGAAAMFALLPGYTWLWLGALVFEFSFVLDCADGQLARLKKIASPVGHLLDFLMDELKAMLIYACIAVRMYQASSYDDRILFAGIFGLFCLASGISLTSFMRRHEYSGKGPTEDGQPAEVGGRKGPIGIAITGLEMAARFVVHYPQYIWICALFDRIDIYFWAYGAVNALYLARSMAAILWKLGRFK